jgi:hypothetical protein
VWCCSWDGFLIASIVIVIVFLMFLFTHKVISNCLRVFHLSLQWISLRLCYWCCHCLSSLHLRWCCYYCTLTYSIIFNNNST